MEKGDKCLHHRPNSLQKRDSTNLMDLLCFSFLFARCNSLHIPVRPRPSALYCTHRSMGLDPSLNFSILRIYFPPCSCMVCAGDHSVMNVIYQLRQITRAPRLYRDAKIGCKQRRCKAYVPARRRRKTSVAAETCGTFQTHNLCVR